MITASDLSANTVQLKKSVLLMDANPERRALRKKIMALHGVEMIGAGDLDEAASIWHRDRYDMVLIDVRRDYRGSLGSSWLGSSWVGGGWGARACAAWGSAGSCPCSRPLIRGSLPLALAERPRAPQSELVDCRSAPGASRDRGR